MLKPWGLSQGFFYVLFTANSSYFFSAMKVDEWLSSPKDYQAGLDILERANINSAILRMLQKGDSFYNRKRMEKEMQAIKERNIKPPASNSKPKEGKKTKADPPNSEQWESSLPTGTLPESLSRVMNALRENYAVVNHFHPLLDITYDLDRKKAFEIKLALQSAWEEIELCWRIINYWKANNEVLPSKYTKSTLTVDISDPAELIKRRNNLRSYISRHQHNPKKAVKVGEWQRELKRIEALIE